MAIPHDHADRVADLLTEIGDEHEWTAELLDDPKKQALEWRKARLAYEAATELIESAYGLPRADPISTMVTVAHHSGNAGWGAAFRRWFGAK